MEASILQQIAWAKEMQGYMSNMKKAPLNRRTLANLRKWKIRAKELFKKFMEGHEELIQGDPEMKYGEVDLVQEMQKLNHQIEEFLVNEIQALGGSVTMSESSEEPQEEFTLSKNQKHLERLMASFESTMEQIEIELLSEKSHVFYTFRLDRMEKTWDKIERLKETVLEEDEDEAYDYTAFNLIEERFFLTSISLRERLKYENSSNVSKIGKIKLPKITRNFLGNMINGFHLKIFSWK